MDDQQLNEIISSLDDRRFEVQGLEDTGKVIPYIGWFWRAVDFDVPYVLGDCGQFIGFMQNNKWGYPEYTVVEDEREQIKAMVVAIAENATQENVQKLFDYLQEFKGNRQWISGY